jgi:hypothetical protein
MHLARGHTDARSRSHTPAPLHTLHPLAVVNAKREPEARTVINTHTNSKQPRPGWAPDPLMVGIRSPDGLVVGLAPATLEFWVRFPNERNQGKQAHPVLKYRVPHGSQPRPGWAPDPLMVGIRSPDGLVVGLAPATLEFWVRFPNERNQGKQAHPVLKYRVPHGSQPRPGWAPDPLMVGIRSPDGLVVGSCTSHPGVLGSIPKREEPGKTGAPCIKVPGSSRVPVRDGQTHPHRPRVVVSHSTCPPLSSSPHAHSFVIGPAVIKHTTVKPIPLAVIRSDTHSDTHRCRAPIFVIVTMHIGTGRRVL